MTEQVSSNEKHELTDYEKELIQFFFKCIGLELSKILIFSIVFYFMHLFPEYIAALIGLLLLRSFSGGLHCKGYMSCLMLSFAILLSGILLGQTVFIPRPFMVICTFVLGVCACLLSPVQASTRPPATPEIIKKAKFRTSLIIFLLFITLCIVPINHYLNIVFWMLVLHVVQLGIAYIIRR